MSHTAAQPDGLDAEPADDVDRLARMLSGDLDWITMRAIDSDPARRYQTALALARDIERHLNHEPVEARPPSRVYAAQKFVSRHRVGVAGAVGVVLALLAGLAIALVGFRQASVDRDAAREALTEAEFVTDFISTAISAVDASELGREVRVADVLDEASRELDQSFEGRPTTEARVRLTLSNAYRSLGDWPNAEREIRRAIRLYREAAGEDDRRAMDALFNLASLRHVRGYPEEAVEIHVDAIERARLADEFTDEQLLGALNNHALMLRDLGRGDEVRTIQEEVLDRREALNGSDHPHTLGAMRNLATTLLRLGELEEAEEMFTEAKQRAVTTHGADSLEAADADFSLADFYLATRQPERAVDHIAAAVARRRTIYGDRHPATLHGLYNHATALNMSGRPQEAVDLLWEVVDAVPEVLEPRHPVASAAISQLSNICARTRWSVLSTDQAQRLTDYMLAAADNPRLPYTTANSFAMNLLNAPEPNAKMLDAALRLARRAHEQTADRADRWIYMDTLALALSAAGEHTEAIRIQEAALQLVPASEQAARAEMQEHLDEIGERANAAATRSPAVR
jgi:tetratricopeptide (TPR) repeat protein